MPTERISVDIIRTYKFPHRMSYSTSTEFHSFENDGFLLTVNKPDFINALVHKMQFYARFHMQAVIVLK